ncbi:MAG: RbsD/FucU domain-containing protein [Firmicutes bacterium]|nr:RbsD/FucU domain-containing protein [Bacillota bacterium]
MLKNIPKIIPPDLLKILCEMGHGDEIVIADGNFPSASMEQRVVYLSGNGAAELFDAILKIFPLDTYEKALYLMESVRGDNVETPIWDEYKTIAKKHSDAEFEHIERYEFYERAKKAYAVIATGETALYANILLKKGVVTD